MTDEQCEYMARWLQLRGFTTHTWYDDGRMDSCKYDGDVCIRLRIENRCGETAKGVVHVFAFPAVSEYIRIPQDMVSFPFDASKTDFKTAIGKAVGKYVKAHPDKAKGATPFLKGGSFHEGEEPSLYPYRMGIKGEMKT